MAPSLLISSALSPAFIDAVTNLKTEELRDASQPARRAGAYLPNNVNRAPAARHLADSLTMSVYATSE